MNLADTYSEVYDILNILGEEYKSKIPFKVYEHIRDERNKNKKNNFSLDKAIEEQNIGEETLDFIAYLNMEYWVDADEKERLLKEYHENDLKKEQELSEKYNVNNLFKQKENDKETEKENITEITVYKESIFIKISNWIKKIFNKK